MQTKERTRQNKTKMRGLGIRLKGYHSHICSRKVAGSLAAKVLDCRPMVSSSSFTGSRYFAFRAHSVLPQQLRCSFTSTLSPYFRAILAKSNFKVQKVPALAYNILRKLSSLIIAGINCAK